MFKLILNRYLSGQLTNQSINSIMKKILFPILFITITGNAQIITKEDSLNAGLVATDKATLVSGYGEGKVEYEMREKTGTANLTRVVLFMGHKFNEKISLFTELELEDTKVAGGSPGGEIAMEQVLLKFNLNKNNYLIGGLFVPRIGIINENHLPATFNGNNRPVVEHDVIPSTWRELGIGWYGHLKNYPSLNYSLSLMNGLNSADFESEEGIREGRFEGRNASASNLAVSGSLLWYVNNFRIQASEYYGGTAGMTKIMGDSLKLKTGSFGTPVSLTEFDIQYSNKGFTFKGLASMVNIPDAETINNAYGNNVAKSMTGAYAEISYNLLYKKHQNKKSFILFTRFETIDMQSNLSANGIANDALKRKYFITGITYKPVLGVSIKVDYVFRNTGVPNPFIQPGTYHTDDNFINIGLAYNF